ncbi:MAG: hypothetical protein JXC33_13365 [Deltaproteobacteria bacterium]|nr:hypothetical protein [Deltaproteobacteria bacterium]
MDKQFLQFWGDFFINYAKGQKQMEDMTKWMREGFKGYADLTDLFRKTYGLDRLSEESDSYLTLWEEAVKDFEKSFKDYLSFLGVVPKQDYLDLVEKYEDLKEKTASQEETIKNLRMLLEKKVMDEGAAAINEYQNLIKKQTAEFQEITESIGQFFNAESSTVKDTKKSTKSVKRPSKE